MIERYGQKPYHLDCLKAVKEFFETGARLAALGESQPYKAAYAVRTENRYGPYHDPGEAEPALAGVPSVCLRVPTGGGKTVLGCRMLLEVRNAIGANSHPVRALVGADADHPRPNPGRFQRSESSLPTGIG